MEKHRNPFLALVEKAMRTQGRAHMRPVIEKELLHYDLLFAMDDAGLLENLTFQGGTALRLCYGSPRFSEDLDFVGGPQFKTETMISMKACLEQYLEKRYELEVTVKEPQEVSLESTDRNIKVSKWQIRIVTHPERPDLPKQMVKIEVANIPAYTREPRQILSNYEFLPDGYRDTIVMTETIDEIFADKIIAFVNCQSYVRHRDIWDMHWLRQRGAKIDTALLKLKKNDYKIEDYLGKAKAVKLKLHDIIFGKEFRTQMSRFLPMDLQEKTLFKENFLILLERETLEALDTGITY
ncbi:MAG: nucleotidyl transferase AbiEii/AbiGii toxin family protein [Myxococcaceae bacterium]